MKKITRDLYLEMLQEEPPLIAWQKPKIRLFWWKVQREGNVSRRHQRFHELSRENTGPARSLSKLSEHDRITHIRGIVSVRAVSASNASNLKTLSSGEHL